MFYSAICQARAETPSAGLAAFSGDGGAAGSDPVQVGDGGDGLAGDTPSPRALHPRCGSAVSLESAVPNRRLLERGPWQGKGLFKLLISFVFKHGLRAASAAEGIVIKRQPSGRQAMCAQQSPQRLAAR